MKKNLKKIAAGVSAAVLVLGGVGIYRLVESDPVASVVLLDVNPSIELHVDDDAEIVRTVALNAEAEEVLAGMKLRDMDVDTAVNAIVGSLLKNGYVDELANSILLSVEDENTARGAKLKQELTEEINAILSATAVNAAILSQEVKSENAAELAEALDVSKGKAELVQNIVKANDTYKADELAKLSVNELNLIVSNPKNEVKNVVSTGKASDSAYIGAEKAKEAAFKHAGVEAANVRGLEVDFDYEYGKMVYELDFASAEYEYDYSIDAKTGEVLYSHKELDDDYVAPVQKSEAVKPVEKPAEPVKQEATKPAEAVKPAAADIGKEKAKSIALSNAGLSESQVTRLHVERDRDDGRIEYNVEFTANGKEYDYEISGSSGKILDYDVEVADRD